MRVLDRGMDRLGGGGGVGWGAEIPAVPINHSPEVMDSVNVVRESQRKLEGINHDTLKTS